MLTSFDIFDDVFKLRDMVDTFFNDTSGRNRRPYDFPYVNVYEKDDKIELKAVLPGVDREDLKIELKDRTLTLSGEKKDRCTDKPCIRRERVFGSFERTFRLPYPVKNDTISASLKNGILTVSLEKSEAAKPRKIEIA